MSLGHQIKSALRNAFSYAVHQESADDHDRKLGVAQAIIAASTPAATQSGADYDAHLLATLLQARTKFLDVLAGKKVAVTLDSRLKAQKLDDKDAEIAGVFYPAPQPKAAGGIAALSDDGTSKEHSRENGLLLEKLARVLTETTPDATVFAHRWYSVALTPDGGGIPVTVSDWGNDGNSNSAAALKNPALKNPPVTPKAATPN